MVKLSIRLTLVVLICFMLSSFSLGLTIVTVEANTFTHLDFNMVVTDLVIHPDKEFIYIISSSGELVKINFETGEKTIATLDYSPNCIAFGNGEIYVGFGSEEMIGIYDADTLQYKDKIMVGDIFFDVAVGHDGYIYTSPEKGKTGSCYLRSFSRESKQEVSKLRFTRTGYLETNPVNNSFVLYSMNVIPTNLFAIKYDNGEFIEQYQYPYHGDYKIGSVNKISPDGKYLFSGNSIILTCDEDVEKDMNFVRMFDKGFGDIAFN